MRATPVDPASLSPLRLVAVRGTRTLLKISTAHPDGAVTASVMLEGGTPPPRTTVRWLDGATKAKLVEPRPALLAAYEAAYANPLTSRR